MDASLTDLISGLFAVASFAGGVAAIIGAGAAVLAVIFAWDNYKNIQKQVKKQGDQIFTLSQMAKQMKIQTDLMEKRIKISAMPQCNIYPGEENLNRNISQAGLICNVINLGVTAFEIEIIEFSKDGEFLHSSSTPFLENKDKFRTNIPIGEDFQGKLYWLYYRDWMHNWYKQKVLIPKMFVEIQNYPPEPIDVMEHPHKHIHKEPKN